MGVVTRRHYYRGLASVGGGSALYFVVKILCMVVENLKALMLREKIHQCQAGNFTLVIFTSNQYHSPKMHTGQIFYIRW